jgi:hypothetical protein
MDTDGDGITDASELASMTDPLDPGSRLRIISFTKAPDFNPVANPVFDLTFTSFPGLSYSLECAQGLNFSGPAVEVTPVGPVAGFTQSMRIQLLPDSDFVRVKRN